MFEHHMIINRNYGCSVYSQQGGRTLRSPKNIYDCRRMVRLYEYIRSYGMKPSAVAEKMTAHEKTKSYARFGRFQVLLQQIRAGKIAATSCDNLRLLAGALANDDREARDEVLDEILEILRLIPVIAEHGKDKRQYQRYGYRFVGAEVIKVSTSIDFGIDVCEVCAVHPDDGLIEGIAGLIGTWIEGRESGGYPNQKDDFLSRAWRDLKDIGIPPEYDNVSDELAYQLQSADLLLWNIVESPHMLLLHGIVGERALKALQFVKARFEKHDRDYAVEFVTKMEKKYPVLRGKI